jgi:molybdopterin biosynthesis enzyme
MVQANGFIVLPEEAASVKAGETVAVQLLDSSLMLAGRPEYP